MTKEITNRIELLPVEISEKIYKIVYKEHMDKIIKDIPEAHWQFCIKNSRKEFKKRKDITLKKALLINKRHMYFSTFTHALHVRFDRFRDAKSDNEKRYIIEVVAKLMMKNTHILLKYLNVGADGPTRISRLWHECSIMLNKNAPNTKLEKTFNDYIATLNIG